MKRRSPAGRSDAIPGEANLQAGCVEYCRGLTCREVSAPPGTGPLLAGLRARVALWHRFVLRDGTLGRMNPIGESAPFEPCGSVRQACSSGAVGRMLPISMPFQFRRTGRASPSTRDV